MTPSNCRLSNKLPIDNYIGGHDAINFPPLLVMCIKGTVRENNESNITINNSTCYTMESDLVTVILKFTC